MSTDVSAGATRRSRQTSRRRRGFVAGFAVVITILAVLGLGGAALTTLQGPRITDVQFDPDAAVTSSGARLILTTTQSLADVSADQVTVSPAADFTVDTSGRTVGLRFTLPLWDETEYTVTISGVSGLGGGPDATLTETFTTPALQSYILQRGDGGDTVYRTDLAGDAAIPVYENPHIEDFRATAAGLVMSTVDDDGHSHLIVTDLSGKGAQELTLPGEGTVSDLQSADRGNLIGYTFTDADISATSGRESALFTGSLAAPSADPVAIERPGGDSRVDDWRFVPDTDAIVMLTFDGALTLVPTPDASGNAADPVALGNAIALDGVARGSSLVIVERVDGPAAVDLTTGDDVAIPATEPGLGQAWSVLGLADGSTLRLMSRLDPDGITVLSSGAVVVSADGSDVRTVFTLDPDDALVQACVSPSGRYVAFTVAPDVVDNPYDGYALALPARLQTRIVSLADGEEVVPLNGFDLSWCQAAPRG